MGILELQVGISLGRVIIIIVKLFRTTEPSQAGVGNLYRNQAFIEKMHFVNKEK